MTIMANVNFLTGGDVAPIRKTGLGMFGGIAPLFQRADVSFFNLVLPLSDRGEPARGKAIAHRGMPVNIDGLAEAGVSCVNLANNHVLDFGDAAMFDTIDLLEGKAIGHFGAGRNLDEARKGCIVEKNGLRIGFLGYSTTLPTGFAATSVCPGVNPLQAYTAYQPKGSLLEYPGTAPHIVSWTDPVHLQVLPRFPVDGDLRGSATAQPRVRNVTHRARRYDRSALYLAPSQDSPIFRTQFESVVAFQSGQNGHWCEVISVF